MYSNEHCCSEKYGYTHLTSAKHGQVCVIHRRGVVHDDGNHLTTLKPRLEPLGQIHLRWVAAALQHGLQYICGSACNDATRLCVVL